MVCEVMCCRSSQDPNRTYHKFPSDTTRCKEWLKILGKKSSDLKQKSVVCSRHFRFKDYYSGGKRLLPDAVPVLRLNNSPKKENPIRFKIRKSEPNSGSNSKSPKVPRKSLLNMKLNTLKEARQSPLKKSFTSKTSLDSLKSKQLVKKAYSTSKNVKTRKEDETKTNLDKAVSKINFTERKTNKSISKIAKRSPLNTRNGPIALTQRRQRFLDRNLRKSSIKEKGGRSRQSIPSKRENDSVSKKENGPTDLNNKNEKESLEPSKSKDSKIDVEPKISVSSEKINRPSLKTTSGSCINDKSKSVDHLNTKDKICLETLEMKPKTKRPVRKRKRLLSEDEDDCPKVQKKNIMSSVSKKEFKQSKTSKNLSGIEETISEMQKKIQVLEKKAILDEMKIESFKKALITQRNKDLQILMDEKENELLLRMDLLYLDYDPRRICRLCLQLTDKNEELIPLFWPMKNQVLLSMIKQTTNVEVESEDGMPSSICGECLEEMKRADWLKRRTQKSNTLIKKFVAMKKGSIQNNSDTSQGPVEVKPKSDDQSPNEEEITEEFKIEDVFSLGNAPMVIFDSITIKQEPESDVENEPQRELNTTFSLTEPQRELNTTFSQTEPQRELNTTFSLTEPQSELNTTYSLKVKKPYISQKCVNCEKTFKNPFLFSVHSRYCTKRFRCSECDRCFLNATLFRKHKQQRYTCYCTEELRYCSDCNISFRWKWQLVFHVLRHNTQVCPFCSDLIHSTEHLQYHVNVAHPNLSNLSLNNVSSLF